MRTKKLLKNCEGPNGNAFLGKGIRRNRGTKYKTSWNHERAERASSSPACCRQRSEYPPGYTVFECRLDGNQPIAQVVQVPPDTHDNILQNKTCMIMETKQSEFGPSSRVAAYPGQRSPRSACNRSRGPGPMSFALETRDHPGGAVACAGKVAQRLSPSIACAQPTTILETSKGPPCQDGPSSRITYGPVGDNTIVPSSETYKPPAFYIQCATTPEGPVARVTQVPQELSKCSGDSGTHYETFVKHDGTCPIATVTQSNKKDESCVQQACEYLETSVCPSGPRARARTLPEGSSNVRNFTHLDVRPRGNGPSARISQFPGDSQSKMLNLRDDGGTVNSGTTACRCHPLSQPVTHAQSPLQFATSGGTKRAVNRVTSVGPRRNGLSPTTSELGGRLGPFKSGRMKKGRTGQAVKTCPTSCCPPPYCSPPYCPPSSLTDPALPFCKPQPLPCARKPLLWPTSCPCPLQPCFNTRPRSGMHPLPGGTVVSRCPAPSLPDIAPVPLGPNQLRDYKPRPKTTGPRKVTSPTRKRPAVDGKSIKPANNPEQKTTKKTKNKKTGSRGKNRRAPTIQDEERDKELSQVPDEQENEQLPQIPSATFVECPAFASKGNQSHPIPQEPVYVRCPAYEEKNNQTCIREEPSHVQCPARESKRTKSIPRFEEPSYVRCPAFESKKSSETSSLYVPRRDELICKYPDYFREKTVETFVSCRAKRNELRDECHLHIPESVLRMSYDHGRNRHARTLVSSCRRRPTYVDECIEIPETRYCSRSELPEASAKHRKKNHHEDTHNDQSHVPHSNDKKDIEHNEKHEKSGTHGSPDKRKTHFHLKAVKSRELRAGVVYYDCNCYHRNGLQQDCPRGGCGGLKHCVTKPWPKCDLSRYFTHKWGKYDDLLDLIPPSTYCGPRDTLYKAKLARDSHPNDEGMAEKIEKSTENRGNTNGKSAKHELKTHRSERHDSAKIHRNADNKKCCKIHENMVQQYAIIPIADTDNGYYCQ